MNTYIFKTYELLFNNFANMAFIFEQCRNLLDICTMMFS
jgi:hypothetical protein